MPVAVRRCARLLVGVLLVGLVGAGCSRDESIPPPPAPTGRDAATLASAAQQTLDRLEKATASADAAAAARLGHDTSTGLLRDLVGNATALGVTGLVLDYVDDQPGALSTADRRRYGTSAWVASVQVSYRLPADRAATHLEVSFTFVRAGRTAAIAAVGGHGDRAPLWMVAKVDVGRAARVLVVAAGSPGVGRFVALARRAVATVGRVLPAWRGDLVLEVPASEEQLDLVLDAERADYANIAAVTTTVDGSLAPDAPIHVFLNPRVFGTLKSEGAEVVLSHETTHVATRAPLAQMPSWLLEGFADYVALVHSGVPVTVAAAQVIKRIRKDGPPADLPSATDLAPTANGLGATYEEAWTACRYLAATYGEDRLIAFYRAVDRGASVPAALRSVVGVSKAEFVAGWRRDLARLAG
jgi:hypothetical protein